MFRKVVKYIKNNIKLIAGLIIGATISGGTVYAATIIFNADQVGFDNTGTSLSSTDVQGALDELYTKTNTWINPNNNFGTPQYYAFGIYKGWCSDTDTECSSYSDFPTTSTNPPSGKTVYATKYTDGGYGLCINRNGTPHCFRGRNVAYESQHMQKVFSGANDSCGVDSSGVYCSASDFSCHVSSDGYVYCGATETADHCDLISNGSVDCNDLGL